MFRGEGGGSAPMQTTRRTGNPKEWYQCGISAIEYCVTRVPFNPTKQAQVQIQTPEKKTTFKMLVVSRRGIGESSNSPPEQNRKHMSMPRLLPFFFSTNAKRSQSKQKQRRWMPRYGATQSSATRSYLAALESALQSSQVQSRVFGVSIGVDVLLCCCMHAR